MNVLKTTIIDLRDGCLIGLPIGFVCSIFLILLAHFSVIFQHYSFLVYLLPLCGLFTIWIYARAPASIEDGNSLIISEAHVPSHPIPLVMAPIIFVTTLLSHLFGASVGREGTAIQIGGSLADAIGRRMGIDSSKRKSFLIAGMGAGFSAALGVPLAGALFGQEVLYNGRFKLSGVITSLSASVVAYSVTLICKAPHTIYPKVEFYFSWDTIFYLVLCALLWGITAWFFIKSSQLINSFTKRFLPHSFIKMLLLSCLLVILFQLEESTIFNGLGLETIQSSFITNSTWLVPLKKGMFTLLSLGAGFKGGEFTPLAFIGSSIGSTFASYFAVSTSLFAALGFCALFGSSSKTPLACTIMACELFGLEILPYALIACFVSYFVSGRLSIYRFQR